MDAKLTTRTVPADVGLSCQNSLYSFRRIPPREAPSPLRVQGRSGAQPRLVGINEPFPDGVQIILHQIHRGLDDAAEVDVVQPRVDVVPDVIRRRLGVKGAVHDEVEPVQGREVLALVDVRRGVFHDEFRPARGEDGVDIGVRLVEDVVEVDRVLPRDKRDSKCRLKRRLIPARERASRVGRLPVIGQRKILYVRRRRRTWNCVMAYTSPLVLMLAKYPTIRPRTRSAE